jgi:AraC-like DNA-binding protein/quercetin dioxygenase-like cupin family protein
MWPRRADAPDAVERDSVESAVRSVGLTYRHGHVIEDHDHDWGQLAYGRSGLMHVSAERAVWVVAPTRAVWLPPGRPHRIAMQGEVAMRCVYLPPDRCGALPAEVRAVAVSPLLRELVLHIQTLGALERERPEHARLADVLVDLLAAAPRDDLHLPLPADARALAAARWLEAHPSDRRPLPEVARCAGASLRTLQRIFTQQTGLSLEAYRQKARLIHAAAALCGGASVTEVALDSGYDSTSAFIAAFRRQLGTTPGRYRPA